MICITKEQRTNALTIHVPWQRSTAALLRENSHVFAFSFRPFLRRLQTAVPITVSENLDVRIFRFLPQR